MTDNVAEGTQKFADQKPVVGEEFRCWRHVGVVALVKERRITEDGREVLKGYEVHCRGCRRVTPVAFDGSYVPLHIQEAMFLEDYGPHMRQS